ncbi:MAG: hypothetical protein KGL39_58770 [Patescibacteria group bacterium]|nr:hypothetical protein [Patescibacteria group bacterium]
MQTTIRVNFVNPPKDGKRYGSVKVGDRYYSYDPSKMKFEKGQSYEIEYKEVPSGDRTYYNILRIVSQPQASTAGGGDQAAVQIFATGIIGRYLGGVGGQQGFPSYTDLAAMVRAAKMAWEEGMKAVPKTAPEPQNWEPDDDAPF